MAKMKYKVGDILQIIDCIYKHRFPIGTEVEVIRVYDDIESYDVCQKPTGDCYLVSEEEVELIKTKQMKTVEIMMRNAVKETADKLLKANNTTTTLEIKTQLRKDFPHFHWIQNTDGAVDGVSEIMDYWSNKGEYEYNSNGTYRIYSSVANSVVKASTKKGKKIANKNIIQFSNLENFLKQNRKDFVNATFDKGGKNIVVPSGFIKQMKKSPSSYLANKKVLKVNVNGVEYDVQ